LTDKIETAYPDNSADAMLNLPNRAALSREFRYARKNYQGEEIDPKNIPEHLQVSACCFRFNLKYYSFHLSRSRTVKATFYVITPRMIRRLFCCAIVQIWERYEKPKFGLWTEHLAIDHRALHRHILFTL
jgi:hypothetical protein